MDSNGQFRSIQRTRPPHIASSPWEASFLFLCRLLASGFSLLTLLSTWLKGFWLLTYGVLLGTVCGYGGKSAECLLRRAARCGSGSMKNCGSALKEIWNFERHITDGARVVAWSDGAGRGEFSVVNAGYRPSDNVKPCTGGEHQAGRSLFAILKHKQTNT